MTDPIIQHITALIAVAIVAVFSFVAVGSNYPDDF